MPTPDQVPDLPGTAEKPDFLDMVRREIDVDWPTFQGWIDRGYVTGVWAPGGREKFALDATSMTALRALAAAREVCRIPIRYAPKFLAMVREGLSRIRMGGDHLYLVFRGEGRQVTAQCMEADPARMRGKKGIVDLSELLWDFREAAEPVLS